MRNNLRIYSTTLLQVEAWLPAERVTRVRNKALLLKGLHMGASVQLGHIARKLPTPGKLPSLVSRMRRFLFPVSATLLHLTLLQLTA